MVTASAVPLVPPPPCVPVHPPIGVQMCGSLASWCVGQRNLCLSYGCFTSCRLKARDKGSVSCHHDADITSF